MNFELIKQEEIEKLKTETLNAVSNFSDSFLQRSKEIRCSLPTDGHRRIFDVLFEISCKAESVSPGSSKLLLEINSNNIKKISELSSKCFEHNDVVELTSSFASPEISKIVYDIVCLGGKDAKVIVDSTSLSSGKTVVEICDSYVFSELTPAFSIENNVFSDPKFVCIDGYIESTSEIHHLLEKANEQKQNILLFVRGLSNDVINTLKVNYDRKTVICIPVIVNYDLTGVNTINDIAVVGGTDIVSSLKGDLISSIELENIPRVDLVSFSNNQMLVKSKSCTGRVRRHMSYLLNKHEESASEAERSFLEKRMKSLNSSYIKVMLPKSDAKTRFSFDQSIRAVNLAVQHGVSKLNGKFLPTATVSSALHFFSLFETKISDLGCIVI